VHNSALQCNVKGGTGRSHAVNGELIVQSRKIPLKNAGSCAKMVAG
jgi:hypothetical protein